MTTFVVKRTRGDADDVDINSDDVDITAQPTYTVDDLFKRSYGPTIYPQDIYAKGPWVDVRAFGASGSSQQTTGSITAGEYALTLTNALDFTNGMGIRISGAGASGADLIAVVESGGGTTILTLDTVASTTVTNVTVDHSDYTAIQAAINYSIENGPTILVPDGTYNITTGLVSTGRFSMMSLGDPRATIFSNTAGATILQLDGNSDYAQIHGIKFLGSSQTGIGLHLYGAREVKASNCVFDSLSYGIHVESQGAQGPFYNSFLGCTLLANTRGVYFSKASGATYTPNRNHFISCLFLSSTAYHVYIEDGDTEQFTKCDFGHSPIMFYVNDANLGVVGCSLEGDSSDTDVYFQNTASGTPFSFVDTTVSHGVWSIHASSKGHLHLRNAESKEHRYSYIVEQDAATDDVFYAQVLSDSVYRFKIQADGGLNWGSGSATRDTNLYRSAANVLKTDDSFIPGLWLRLPPQTYVTISGGVITATGSYMTVDTEAGGAADDLDTINGGTAGDILILEGYENSHVVTVKHGTGNIHLNNETDVLLDARRDKLVLVYGERDANWHMLSHSNNNTIP